MGTVVESIKDIFTTELKNQYTGNERASKRENELKSWLLLSSMKRKWILYLVVFELLILFVVLAQGIGTISYSLIAKNFSLCLASQFIGIILGFLFGKPKTPDSLNGAQFQLLILKNTNLEQVSDWLTKLLLGATLTQFDKISNFVLYSGTAFGVSGTDSYYFGVGAIIFTFLGGFLLAFLFASLLLTNSLVILMNAQIMEAKESVQKESDARAANKINEQLAKIDDSRRTDFVDEVSGIAENSIALADQQIREKAKKIVPDTYDFDSDPWKNKFGKKAIHDNIEFKATVTPESDSLYKIELVLEGKEPGVLGENSTVAFFIHPTFSNYKRFAKVQNNTARLLIYSAGSFTAGALAEGGSLEFELDLANIPNVPLKFREV